MGDKLIRSLRRAKTVILTDEVRDRNLRNAFKVVKLSFVDIRVSPVFDKCLLTLDQKVLIYVILLFQWCRLSVNPRISIALIRTNLADCL